MARFQPRSGAKRAHEEKDPKLFYDHLPLAKQIACYNFYTFIRTQGNQGWSLESPGSVYNWRSSNYIQENIKQSSWRKIAQRMSLLAQHLSNRGITLEDPFEQHRNTRAEVRAEVVEATVVDKEEQQPQEVDTSYDSYPSPPETESEEEETPMACSRTPVAGARKGSSSSRKKKSSVDADALCSSMSSLKINSAARNLVGMVAVQPMARPLLPTRWEQWDEEISDVVGFCKLVMSLDPTTELSDLDLDWVDERHFKIRIKWPPYLINYFSLAAMDLDEKKEPIFPRRHSSELGMGKNTNKLKDDHGDIFEECVVYFPENDMDTSLYEPKILQGTSNGVPVKLLRIIFHEAREDGSAKPIAIEVSENTGDLCKLGTQQGGAGSPPTPCPMDTDSDDNDTTPFKTPAVDPRTTPLPGSPPRTSDRRRPRDEFVAPRSGKKAKRYCSYPPSSI